jgi:hypothetical protein
MKPYDLACDLINDCLKHEVGEFPIVAVSPVVMLAIEQADGLQWHNERPYFFGRLLELADEHTALWEFRPQMGEVDA